MSNKVNKIDSVSNSITLLRNIIESPSDYNENMELLSKLKSQGDFATYSNSEIGIISVSLNTHKKYADILLDNGFEEFNHFRKRALKKLTKLEQVVSNPKNYSKQYYMDLTGEQKDYIDTLKKENYMLTIMVDELRSKLKQYIYNPSEDPERDFSDINRIVIKKLNHIEGIHDVN